MPDKDGQLYIRFLTTGDQNALEVLFNKYKDFIHIWIRTKCRYRRRADDGHLRRLGIRSRPL